MDEFLIIGVVPRMARNGPGAVGRQFEHGMMEIRRSKRKAAAALPHSTGDIE